MLLSRIGLSIVNPRTKGKITELWGLGFTRSSLAAVCGGTHDWRWQGSVREYTRVDLERLDKRPRDRKPGTHREVPKPPSPAVASELKRIQLTEKSSLKDPYNVQNRKIFGRGGGRSRYCRRGDKGFKVRHSIKTPICIDYAGGKPPYETCIAPRFGSVKKKIQEKMHITAVTFVTLKQYIVAGIIDPSKGINLETFVRCGIIREFSHGVRLLTNGMEDFDYVLDIEVNEATTSAIEKIKALGGKITLVYYNKDLLDYYRNPSNFFFKPPQTFPTTIKHFRLYSDPRRGGFLADAFSKDDALEDCIAKLRMLQESKQEEISEKLLSLPSGYRHLGKKGKI